MHSIEIGRKAVRWTGSYFASCLENIISWNVSHMHFDSVMLGVPEVDSLRKEQLHGCVPVGAAFALHGQR